MNADQQLIDADSFSEHEDRLLHFFVTVLPEFVAQEDLERFVSILAPGIKAYVDSVAKDSARIGMEAYARAYHGPYVGPAVIAKIRGEADVSNAKLAKYGVTRAAVSKIHCKVLRGFAEFEQELRKEAEAKRGAPDAENSPST